MAKLRKKKKNVQDLRQAVSAADLNRDGNINLAELRVCHDC